MSLVLDYLAIDIDIVLEMHSQIAWYLELHILVTEWFCTRNLMVLLSAACGVAPNFVESVALLRHVILGAKTSVLVTHQ